MLNIIRFSIVLFFLQALSSCSSFNDDDAYVDGRKLVPLRSLYAKKTGGHSYTISPDGKRLAWIDWHKGGDVLFVKNLLTQKVHNYQFDINDEFFFIGKSRYIGVPVFSRALKKRSVAIVDLDAKKPFFRVLLPQLPGDLSIVKNTTMVSDRIVLKHQLTDRSAEYLLMNYVTHEFEHIDTGAGNVSDIELNERGEVSALIRSDNKMHILERLGTSKKVLYTCSNLSARIELLGVEENGTVNFSSNCDNGFLTVKSVSLQGNTITRSCNGDCEVDLDQVIYNPATKALAFGVSHKETFFIDNYSKIIYSDFPFFKSLKGYISIESTSSDFSKWIVKNSNSLGDVYYLFKPKSGHAKQISSDLDKKYQAKVISPKWVALPSGNKKSTYAYYYPPQGRPIADAPAVILLHGGPHDRAYPDYNPDTLMLVNRGYQVLDINYRGSIGFGSDYQNAGKKNIRAMLDDIDSGIDWLEATPRSAKSIAVMGGSFGGYLSILANYYNDVDCGVSINGLYDVQKTAIDFPVQGSQSLFYQYFSDDYSSIDNLFGEFSPNKINNFERSNLLIVHGRYDQRISIDTAEQFYQKNKKDNNLKFVAVNDGHDLNRWYARMETYREVEKVLAECLGGREAGFDYYFLAKPFYEFKDRK